jgi:cell division protein FtsB
MKKIILTASWFAVAVYCLLTGVYGPAGLRALAQAEKAAAAMHLNIEFLENLNGEYALEWQALRSDAGLTALQGRSLGFIASDEVVVRVALPAPKTNPASIGERVLFVPGRSLPMAGIRLAALYVWLFLVLSGLVLKLLDSRKSRGGLKPSETQSQREIRDQTASRT